MTQLEIPQLPASVQELAGLLGVENAMALVRVYGGCDYLEVPRTVRTRHPLAGLIGREGLERLVAVYGGDRLHVPRAALALKSLRNREIVSKYDEGARVNDLVHEFDLSAKQIRWILKQHQEVTLVPNK